MTLHVAADICYHLLAASQNSADVFSHPALSIFVRAARQERTSRKGCGVVMRQLRAYGIYKLPGVKRPVFAVPADGGYLLYDSLLGEDLPPRFEVKPDGRVTNWHGDEMSVRVEEFQDTGQTYMPSA